ncbi:MAG: type VI secretion system membrane subunit TssM [Gammaproteobacteria bacterium]|nr:type VI secretion system membrane subunit TssM [Gammaproteobacteria bacterium]
MRAIARFLRSGWVIGLLGLCLIALLIWNAGPLFAFAGKQPLASEDSRFIAIILVVALWVAYRVFLYVRAKAVSARVVDAILGRVERPTAGEAPQPAAQEVAALEHNLQRAVDVLKRGKGSRLPGRQYIYQLPWYVLIGPPGSGKTTALTSSQLRFLVTNENGQGRELRGVHGTRDCDWFFTDEAVMLDTAGRYVTQDSREDVDRGAWLGFLKLLKTYRKRRPINGVLVCVSLPDIVTQSEAQSQRESQAIRLRIRELHEQLGIHFPIYLLFTKCDLLAGFTEFFDDLGNDERQQVWGTTFATNADLSDVSGLFGREFKRLEQRINERLVTRLDRERDPRRRALIYGFPQQFASVQLAAERFIRDTFEATRYELPAALRGVYFTSGTQTGTPLDRLTAALSSSFGLGRQQLASFSGHGKSYFVSRLLSDVVFREAGLANSDPNEEKRRRWMHRGVLAAAVLVTALVALAWVNSYFKNRKLIDQFTERAAAVAGQVEQVGVADTGMAAALPALDSALQLTGRDAAGDSVVSAVLQVGLDQRPGLESEATARYRALLRDLLLPRLVLRLEERLRSDASVDEVYAALRTYLMLRGDHFDAPAIVDWVQNDFVAHDLDVVSKADREKLVAHVTNLFERGPVRLPLDLDANVVQQARGKLLGMSLADRVYSQIIDNGALWRDVADFRASDKVGNVFNYVFATEQGGAAGAGVDRRFTFNGYVKFRKHIADTSEQLAGETWVVGEGFGATAGDRLDEVRGAVLRRYLEEYKSRWDGFLMALTIVPMGDDLNKAIDVLQILASDDSPLKKLLIAVERETTLSRADDLVDKGSDAAVGALKKFGDTVGSLLQTPAPVTQGLGGGAWRHPVDEHFVRLNNLVRAAEGGSPGIDGSLALLTELTGYLKSLQGMRGLKMVDEVKSLSDSVVGRLEQHAARQPTHLRSWLEVVDWQVRQLLGGRALAHLNDEWRATVWRDYQRGLSGKYPLSPSSARDATLEDFGDFFGPDGTMDRFFREYLADFVDTSGRVWNVPEKSPIHISREVLVAMQRAAVIREAFFASRDKRPAVSFSLAPITMDIGINEFSLDLDGQTVRFDHSATRPKAVQWPGPRATGTVSMRVSPPKAQGSGGRTIDGPWAWFRLLDDSKVTRRAADQFDITFDIDGRKIEYELRAGSALNPFNLSELERFRCPELL